GGKQVAFHCQPVQWVNEENLIDPADLSSVNEVHRRRAVDRIRRLLDEAAAYGAAQVFVASGRNPASGQPYDAQSDRVQQQALHALALSLRTLPAEARGRTQHLPRHPRRAGRGAARNPPPAPLAAGGRPAPGPSPPALAGPAARAVALLEPLRGEGLDNVGVAIDLARLRLNGEGPEVVAGLAPYL